MRLRNLDYITIGVFSLFVALHPTIYEYAKMQTNYMIQKVGLNISDIILCDIF